MPGRQLEGAGSMVAVLVCDENAGQVFGGQAETAQSECDLARAETAIEENSRGPRFDQQRIAAAAATQRSEAHRYFNWS